MKVLWFSNTPASGSDYLNMPTVGGGWLKSLDILLKDYIDLSIAFYYPKDADDFKFKGINYYPITNKNWKLVQFKRMLKEDLITDEHLSKYFNIIEQVKPDIIHIHGTENPFGYIITKTAIPVVVSIQGNITVLHHKYTSGISKEYLFKSFTDFNSFRSFPFYKSFKKTFNYFTKASRRESNVLQNCKYVIGRTNWDERITRILAPQSKYFHNDEILRDIFYKVEWLPHNNNKLIIHTTNGNSPYKGFETLCYAVTLLNNLGINYEWRVAGIMEDDLVVKVTKKYLKENYPEKGLKLLGKLDEINLSRKLLEADIYVMPSHIENSPNNLCEAMMLGMPCIATYAGGTPTILKDEEEGLLVQDGDPWALAGAIKELITNKDKAICLGKKARQKALTRHNKEKVVNELLKIYQMIIDEHKITK